MELRYDKSCLVGEYDARNLTRCMCGKHKYPSKKMFIEFLEQYKDIDAIVDIQSVTNFATGKVRIYLELEYTMKVDEKGGKQQK